MQLLWGIYLSWFEGDVSWAMQQIYTFTTAHSPLSGEWSWPQQSLVPLSRSNGLLQLVYYHNKHKTQLESEFSIGITGVTYVGNWCICYWISNPLPTPACRTTALWWYLITYFVKSCITLQLKLNFGPWPLWWCLEGKENLWGKKSKKEGASWHPAVMHCTEIIHQRTISKASTKTACKGA